MDKELQALADQVTQLSAKLDALASLAHPVSLRRAYAAIQADQHAGQISKQVENGNLVQSKSPSRATMAVVFRREDPTGLTLSDREFMDVATFDEATRTKLFGIVPGDTLQLAGTTDRLVFLGSFDAPERSLNRDAVSTTDFVDVAEVDSDGILPRLRGRR